MVGVCECFEIQLMNIVLHSTLDVPKVKMECYFIPYNKNGKSQYYGFVCKC